MISQSLSTALRYPSLHRAQWKSRESLDEIQWTRFEAILRFAYANSPFYRHRFDDAGIKPENIENRSDLERIPITTREDLRHPEGMICSGYDASDLHCSLTTGSTGRRTRTYFDNRSWILAKFLLKMRARLTTGVSPTDRIALLQESDSANNTTPWRERFFRLRPFSIEQPIPTLLEQLRDFDPTVLYGFPSHLQRLAEAVDGELRISRVYTSGELLVTGARRRIEAAFEAPVLDIYGCTEVKEIAWQCQERGGYHINSDWLLVEVLQDERGNGREGPILVTSLFNQAMPIIRYRVGDNGALLQERCGCGRGLPLMRPTAGRSVNYFEIPDGSSVSPYTMTYALERVRGLRQFQIIQVATDRVTVKIVTDPGLEHELSGEIKSRLSEVLPGVEIEAQRVERLESDRTGKFRVVFSRVGEAE